MKWTKQRVDAEVKTVEIMKTKLPREKEKPRKEFWGSVGQIIPHNLWLESPEEKQASKPWPACSQTQ